MVLIYANSKERAMLLATNIDGVVLKDKQKVWPVNYTELHDALEAELIERGFICSFFRGESCTFIYTDGMPCELNKMADYDPAYARLSTRPVPFIPKEFQRHCIDKELEQRLPLYQKMWRDATSVINAASDDIAGELSFLQLMELCSDGGYKSISRARPHIMSETPIIGAFNSLQSSIARDAFAVACDLDEKLNWLVPCNASNVLSMHNFERIAIPVGRMESLVLAQVAEKERLSLSDPRLFDVEVTVTSHSGSLETTVDRGPFLKEDAEKISVEISSIGNACVKNSIEQVVPSKIPLLNAFCVQHKVMEKFPSVTSSQIADALDWLFYNSYITWPSLERAIPWGLKQQMTASITALAQTPAFQDRVLPKDVDDYQDWDTADPLFNQTGIIVTDKPLLPTMPQVAKDVYEIIAASNVVAIRMIAVQRVSRISFTCGDYLLRHFKATTTYQNIRSDIQASFAGLSNNDSVKIDSCHIQAYDNQNHTCTEREVVEILGDLLRNTFSYSSRKISHAIENLILWGHLTRTNEGGLVLTDKGRTIYKYIRNTSLTNVTEVLDWDRRLLAIAQNKVNPDMFIEDLCNYVEDLCAELTARGDEIIQYGGRSFDDLVCPVCGATVELMPDSGKSCACSKCSFSVPSSVKGHVMTKLDVAELVTSRATRVIHDLVSKKNAAFSARLILDAKGRISQSFDSIHPCPFCQSVMSEYAWGMKCKNETCGFSLNRDVCAHELTDTELASLFSGGMTPSIRFINKKTQRPFGAKLSLGDDKTLKFHFPPREAK